MKQTDDMGASPLRLLVSRCLLGEAVRYDGASKPDTAIQALAGQAGLLPVCPEVDAGLAIPRPAVQLVETRAGIRMLGVENPALDVTGRISGFADDFLRAQPQVHGAILKARSPSCGVDDSPLFDQSGRQQGTTSGLFAHATRCQAIPVISEAQFTAAEQRNRFFEQVFVYRYWLERESNGLDITAFHHRLRGHVLARILTDASLQTGAERLASLAGNDSKAYLRELMNFLATPVASSTVEQAVIRLLQTQGRGEAARQVEEGLKAGDTLPHCLAVLGQHAGHDDCLLLTLSPGEWSLRFS